MKEYILVPVLIASILGVALELEELGMQASEKTLQFAQEAVSALDCAYEARPITECSPTITNTQFKEEIEQTNKLLQELRDQTSSSFAQQQE
ncbi:MAG: hypothetical protein ACMXYD_03040 [Candidatus Woesearchaeota archaeon]